MCTYIYILYIWERFQLQCATIYIIMISIPLGTSQLRHTLTTRFLLTCISSFFFDGEKTLDDLHEFIARDATELYHQGLTVALKTFR